MSSNRITIGVERWCSWESADTESHYARFDGTHLFQEVVSAPDVSSVPPMLRRRLGPVARVVFHLLIHGLESGADDAVVFSSRMGEIQRTQELIESIAQQQPLSPTAFSLSVHNAIAGLWSLIQGVKLPLVAISPPAGSPVPGLIEAFGLIASGERTSVNLLCYEEPLPDFYRPSLEGPVGIRALGMRLVPAEQAGLKIELNRVERADDEPLTGFAVLAGLLQARGGSDTILEPQSAWQLELM